MWRIPAALPFAVAGYQLLSVRQTCSDVTLFCLLCSVGAVDQTNLKRDSNSCLSFLLQEPITLPVWKMNESLEVSRLRRKWQDDVSLSNSLFVHFFFFAALCSNRKPAWGWGLLGAAEEQVGRRVGQQAALWTLWDCRSHMSQQLAAGRRAWPPAGRSSPLSLTDGPSTLCHCVRASVACRRVQFGEPGANTAILLSNVVAHLALTLRRLWISGFLLLYAEHVVVASLAISSLWLIWCIRMW